jgi:SAM-dependent methyltransferase
VIDGVPRLLPQDVDVRTAKHFESEFTVEQAGDADFASEDTLTYLFFTRTGLDPAVYELAGRHGLYPTSIADGTYAPDASRLQEKVVLDAGCGGGRFLPSAARYADYVVGLDLGEHVSRAVLRSHDLDNVDVVQGSVLQPPFRRGAFDYAYSLGVVHHTDDPRQAVDRIAECVQDGGAISIWVYPPGYWGGFPRNLVNRAVHAVVSRLSPASAHWVAERLLYPLGRLQERVARRRWTKVIGAPLFLISVPRHPSKPEMITTTLDYFATPIIHTHADAEVRGWLASAGFGRLTKLPLPTSWLGEAKERH